MIKLSSFGNVDKLMIFDEKEFRINNKENYIKRKHLEQLLFEDDHLTYLRLISEEHEKRKTEYVIYNPTIEFITKYLNIDYDFLYLLQFCEPERHNPSERFGRYPNSKIAKRCNLLEYALLRELSEKWRLIADMAMQGQKASLPTIRNNLRTRLFFWK
jgi:hypothetical protein